MTEIISPNGRKGIGASPSGRLTPLNTPKQKLMFRFVSVSRIASPPTSPIEKRPKSAPADGIRAHRKTGSNGSATMSLRDELKGQKTVDAPESHMQAYQRTPSLLSSYTLNRFFGLVGQLMNYSPSPTSALARTMMDLPGGGLPPLFCPALVFGLPSRSQNEFLFGPQALDQVQESATARTPWSQAIEISSGRKKNGRFAPWKEVRVVLDTGSCNNYVTLEVVKDLRIPEYMPLSSVEQEPATTASGTLPALGAVNLIWRGIPGGQIRNCLRNFEMRFLIIDIENAPFEILIGGESLWEYRILQAPILHMDRGTTALPGPPGGTRNVDRTGYEKRKAKHLQRMQGGGNGSTEENHNSENAIGDIGNILDDGQIADSKPMTPSTPSMVFDESPSPRSLRSPRTWGLKKHPTSKI